MSELTAEISKTPEIMTEEEITNLLNSVSGARNIALLMCVGDEFGFFTSTDVNKIFKPSLETPGLLPDGVGQTSRGFVAQQLKNSSPEIITVVDTGDGTKRRPPLYSLTQFAKEDCLPLAGQIYRISKLYDISPIDLVGFRSKPRSDEGIDAPFARLALLASLLKLSYNSNDPQPINVTQLMEITGLNTRVIHNHLPSLERAQIITRVYSSRRARYPVYATTAPKNQGSTADRDDCINNSRWNLKKRALAKWLHERVSEAESASTIFYVDQVLNDIQQQNLTESFFASGQPGQQKAAINDAMDLLTTMGILTVQEDDTAHQVDGYLLTPTGKNAAQEYVQAVGMTIIRSPQARAAGANISRRVRHDSRELAWLLGIDQSKGALATHEPHAEKEAQLQTILAAGAMTVGNIIEATGWKLRATHSTLKNSDKVRSYKVGRLLYWELEETDSKSEQ